MLYFADLKSKASECPGDMPHASIVASTATKQGWLSLSRILLQWVLPIARVFEFRNLLSIRNNHFRQYRSCTIFRKLYDIS